MIKCLCRYEDDTKYEYAYEINDFHYNLQSGTIPNGKKGEYIELPCTFDIETSTFFNKEKSEQEGKEIYEAFMYQWQICIEGDVVFGRTWKQLITFLDRIIDAYKLNKNKKLVIYVHNLSYEFHFMYRFLKLTNVFCTDVHKVLRIYT